MQRLQNVTILLATLVALIFGRTSLAVAADESAEKQFEPQVIKLADGKLELAVPGGWKAVKPRNRIILHEFSIPAAAGDEQPGRLTIMSAGGGIEANIARWVGQFLNSEGQPIGEDAKKVEKKKVDDLEIHLVDLRGDYQDRPAPFVQRAINRPNYRMLAAIIPTEKEGTWFIKFYGPQKTVAAAEKAWGKMIAGIESRL